MEFLICAIDRAATNVGSKAELARRMGISPQRLNDYRSGLRHMPYSAVRALATWADLSAEKLWAKYSGEWEEEQQKHKRRAKCTIRRMIASR